MSQITCATDFGSCVDSTLLLDDQTLKQLLHEPADGPAITFRFALNENLCGKLEEPFIVISIIENLPPLAPRDYPKGSVGVVLARRRLRPGQCEAVTSGTLHLAKVSKGNSTSGKYELYFREGSVEKGSFDAVAVS